MAWVPGGEFLMGSQDFYPEEGPVREVSVEGFWIDEHPVTVAEFRRFVTATGHVTTAELAPTAEDYPDADPELLVPGSLVFHQPPGPVSLDDFRQWWQWTPGAFWRRPEGPGSHTGGRERHPVVHVSYTDAAAYAAWAGKQLASEAEWERAARGGLERKVFAWGDEFMPRGKLMANVWQGEFPWRNLRAPAAPRTTAIRSFPPNGFGLYDMTGNTWEWTCDVFSMPTAGGPVARSGCCAGSEARVQSASASGADAELIAERVIKGGSHLCAPNYCLRYRPAARQRQTIDSSTAHIGFRCVIR
jgi:formylglycine-generating enzyme